MQLHRLVERSTIAAIATLSLAPVACDYDASTSPNVWRPGLASQQLVIRAGAGPDVLADDVVVDRAWIDETTLNIEVHFSGGCRTHDFAAIAPAAFLESHPEQLPVYLRHQAHADPCETVVMRVLSFDIRPAVQLHVKHYRTSGPFVLALTTKSGSASTVLRVPVP